MDDGRDPLCDNAGVDRPDPDGCDRDDRGVLGMVAAEFRNTGVVAMAEIPAEYGIEILKAQAVLGTEDYICRLVETEQETDPGP